MTRQNAALAATILIVLISASSVLARPVRLQYRFKTGQSDRYKVNIVTQISNTPPAALAPEPDSVDVIMSQVVKGITVAMGANFELFIKGDGDNARRITPTSHKFTVDRLGELVPDADQKPTGITGTLIGLPEKAVSIGESWPNKIYFEAGMGSADATCTYRGIVTDPTGQRAHKVVRTYIGRVKNPPTAPKLSNLPAGSSVKTQIEGTETYYLDRIDCRLLSADTVTTLTVTVIPPKTAGSQEMRRQRTTMKTTIRKTQ